MNCKIDGPHPTEEKIADPVLFDEYGVGVFRLFSASILHFPSGYKQLQTVPALLPNNFPLGAFASECAPALSLESGPLKLRVRVKGTMLVLADEVNGKERVASVGEDDSASSLLFGLC